MRRTVAGKVLALRAPVFPSILPGQEIGLFRIRPRSRTGRDIMTYPILNYCGCCRKKATLLLEHEIAQQAGDR